MKPFRHNTVTDGQTDGHLSTANKTENTDVTLCITRVWQVTLAALTDSEVNEFRKEVARRMLLPPWDSYIKSNINVCYTLSNCFTPTLNAFLHSSSRFRSFIHLSLLSLFAQKFQHNTTKSKRTELDENVAKHWHPSVLKSNAKFRPSNLRQIHILQPGATSV